MAKIKTKKNGDYKLTINQDELNSITLLLGRSSYKDLQDSALNWEVDNIVNDAEMTDLYELLFSMSEANN